MLIKWESQYNLGISNFDEQHHKIACSLNHLFGLARAGAKTRQLAEHFQLFSANVKEHFESEERVIKSELSKSDFDEHKHNHDYFLMQLRQLHHSLKKSNSNRDIELFQHLKTWFLSHTQGLDRYYAECILFCVDLEAS